MGCQNSIRPQIVLTSYRDALRKDIYWQWRFGRARLLSRWWDLISVTSRTAILTWFVLAIELTLSWNSVGGIYELSSVGQLIPFVTGLLGLLRSVHLVIMESLAKVHALRPIYFLSTCFTSSLVTYIGACDIALWDRDCMTILVWSPLLTSHYRDENPDLSHIFGRSQTQRPGDID